MGHATHDCEFAEIFVEGNEDTSFTMGDVENFRITRIVASFADLLINPVRYVLAAARCAAAARRSIVGWSSPSLGDCPCGAPGGTANHCFKYGSSTTLDRSNFVSKLRPAKAKASRSARVMANSPGCNASTRWLVP